MKISSFDEAFQMPLSERQTQGVSYVLADEMMSRDLSKEIHVVPLLCDAKGEIVAAHSGIIVTTNNVATYIVVQDEEESDKIRDERRAQDVSDWQFDLPDEYEEMELHEIAEELGVTLK